MKQPIQTERPKHAHLPLWKRCTLITTLLLTGGPLIAMASSQAAYADTSNDIPYQTITIPPGPRSISYCAFLSWKKNGKPKMNILRITVVCKDGGLSGTAGIALFDSTGAAAGTPGSCNYRYPLPSLTTIW